MEKILNWDSVETAGESKPLKPGVYGLVIKKVANRPEAECLDVWVDITKGEFEGYFERVGNDAGKYIRSYKEKALPFFKAFITAVEKSNSGYVWDWDETKLVGKNIIGEFGEEEYVSKEGERKTIVKCRNFRSLEAFRDGKCKVPELKKLTDEEFKAGLERAGVPAKAFTTPAPTTASLDDLPF